MGTIFHGVKCAQIILMTMVSMQVLRTNSLHRIRSLLETPLPTGQVFTGPLAVVILPSSTFPRRLSLTTTQHRLWLTTPWRNATRCAPFVIFTSLGYGATL